MRTTRRKKRVRGFTLIEVMFSLLIFISVLSGIVALQRVSAHGAMMGKRHTAAVNVASFFLSQVQTEFSAWWSDQGKDVLTGTEYPLISYVLNGGSGIRVWRTLDAGAALRIGEYLGHSSLPGNDDTSRFCVHYMLEPRQAGVSDPNDQTGAPATEFITVWKIHVRVSWTKDGRFGQATTWRSCSLNDVNARLVANTDSVIELAGAATRELASCNE